MVVYPAASKTVLALSRNWLFQEEEEVEMVLDHKVSDVELHKILGRSVSAIQTMRTKLKNENVPDYIAEMKLEY